MLLTYWYLARLLLASKIINTLLVYITDDLGIYSDGSDKEDQKRIMLTMMFFGGSN